MVPDKTAANQEPSAASTEVEVSSEVALEPITAKRRKRPKAPKINPEERRRLIAEAAYLRAERRGFSGGSADEDWLDAEVEVDQALGGED
jgi:hypothetical protein